MARARNIKPGFFRNADLVELSFEARLLFIGLWTIADRDGRMEDRPKQIKMELFPADSVDVDGLLNQLVAINMIERYSHEGQRVIQVVNFTKHQNPHRDEKASTLPDRDGNVAATKEAPKKHGANTVQAPCDSGADTVAIGLIPESLLLNPDSLIPDPLQEPGESAAQPAPRKPKVRASRKCPEDFALTLDMLDWAAQNAPGVNVQAETEKFRDHTFKDPKSDWPGTWRNWLRRAAENPGKGVGPPGRQIAPDRVSRQLETAALMTGAVRPPMRTTPTQPAEIVDAEFKLIQH